MTRRFPRLPTLSVYIYVHIVNFTLGKDLTISTPVCFLPSSVCIEVCSPCELYSGYRLLTPSLPCGNLSSSVCIKLCSMHELHYSQIVSIEYLHPGGNHPPDRLLTHTQLNMELNKWPPWPGSPKRMTSVNTYWIGDLHMLLSVEANTSHQAPSTGH